MSSPRNDLNVKVEQAKEWDGSKNDSAQPMSRRKSSISNEESLEIDGLHTSSRFHVAKVKDGDNKRSSSVLEVPGEHGMDGNIPVQERTLSYGTYYDTKNIKSLRHYTREALPRVDHYRNVLSVHGHLSRPTMDELHASHANQTEFKVNLVENKYSLEKYILSFAQYVGPSFLNEFHVLITICLCSFVVMLCSMCPAGILIMFREKYKMMLMLA